MFEGKTPLLVDFNCCSVGQADRIRDLYEGLELEVVGQLVYEDGGTFTEAIRHEYEVSEYQLTFYALYGRMGCGDVEALHDFDPWSDRDSVLLSAAWVAGLYNLPLKDNSRYAVATPDSPDN
jgi:hypothetical protein